MFKSTLYFVERNFVKPRTFRRANSCFSNDMEFKSINYWVSDRVANIQLNRPKRLNAISMKMPTELAQAVEMANFDADVKVLLNAYSSYGVYSCFR